MLFRSDVAALSVIISHDGNRHMSLRIYLLLYEYVCTTCSKPEPAETKWAVTLSAVTTSAGNRMNTLHYQLARVWLALHQRQNLGLVDGRIAGRLPMLVNGSLRLPVFNQVELTWLGRGVIRLETETAWLCP